MVEVRQVGAYVLALSFVTWMTLASHKAHSPHLRNGLNV